MIFAVRLLSTLSQLFELENVLRCISSFFAAMQEKRAAANVGSQPTGGLLEASAQWGRSVALSELTVEGGEETYESQWRHTQETAVLCVAKKAAEKPKVSRRTCRVWAQIEIRVHIHEKPMPLGFTELSHIRSWFPVQRTAPLFAFAHICLRGSSELRLH